MAVTPPTGATGANGVPRHVIGAVVAAGTLLVWHFAMTFLHVTTINPVKIEHQQVVNAWMHPFFGQNWRLFAPNPIDVDRGVLVKVRTADGTESDFVDITSPTLVDRYHNLLPSRASYDIAGPVNNIFDLHARRLQATETTKDDQVDPVIGPDGTPPGDAAADTAAHLFLDDPATADLSPEDRQAYLGALSSLRDMSWHYAAAGSADPDTSQLQVRVVVHTFPRYSDRLDTGTGEISFHTSPWLPARGPVAPSSLDTDGDS